MLIVLAHLVYPYPQRRNKPDQRFAIAIEALNAYDIMDFVENITCIQTYSTGWSVLLFIALAVSTLRLAFPISLIEEDEDDPLCGRILSSTITLVFTDVLFAIMRGHVMIQENSLQLGFNFFSKNVMSAFCRVFLIVRAISNMLQ